MRFARLILTAGLIAAVACTGDDGDATTTPPVDPPATGDSSATTVANEDGDAPAEDRSLEALLAAFDTPEPVDSTTTRGCERYGYPCSLADATAEQIDATTAALDVVSAAMAASDQADVQLELGLAALHGIDGVGHVEYDPFAATMVAFTVDGGPRAAVFTVAAIPQEGGEVAPVDDSFVPPAEQPGDDAGDAGDASPDGFRGLVRGDGVGRPAGPQLPRRFEPAGGPAQQRSAAVFNPFGWAEAAEITAIFDAEEQYSTVVQFDGGEVNPFNVGAIGSYDAVHIFTHGGGSCPAWTDDRDECSSTFVGGPASSALEEQELSSDEPRPAAFHSLCSSGGTWRYCFSSEGFSPNTNGIVFFAVCGSDAGFNNTGAGASVGWTGTTQKRVAHRSAMKFWKLMITEGVEFEFAREVVKGGGYDSHAATYWASCGTNSDGDFVCPVSAFTESVFAGRNLRGRDVVEMRLDGNEPRGQTLQFTGLPQDGRAETFPAEGQQITFDVEGVRTGSEQGVTIEVRGDGVVWPSDINLGADGTLLTAKEGYGTWRVTLRPDDVEIPDLAWSDLDASRAPVELEIRAFETPSEYTAYRGTVRLGTEVEFSGPIPIFEDLEDGLPPNGELTGNDLRVTINTGTGELTGSMRVEIFGSGISVGFWTLSLDGTYDPETSTVSGTVDGVAQGTLFSGASDSGSGTFQGSADLGSRSIRIQLGIGGASQVYDGTIVE